MNSKYKLLEITSMTSSSIDILCSNEDVIIWLKNEVIKLYPKARFSDVKNGPIPINPGIHIDKINEDGGSLRWKLIGLVCTNGWRPLGRTGGVYTFVFEYIS